MKLVGRLRLTHLPVAGQAVQEWMRHWLAEVATAQWKEPSDVREQFPNVHQVDARRFNFPISGSRWVVCLQIAFPHGVALIIDLRAANELA